MLLQPSAVLLLKKNFRFYIQGLLTSVTLASIVVCFNLISQFTTNRWQNFLTTTFIWLIAHVMDGVIIISFNKPFRILFWRPCSVLKQKKNTRSGPMFPST
ncbi:hypothetical protein RB195_005358 [Necator americanus]